ncbi:hypothetical protein [Nocardiopsis tropica]|uniref:Immunity protein 35 domain-containing protein n=1 Tax=Nocardiopsis tropica TaxID=109330 RepID=A0ABV1ZXI8_9ACTN|nr:YrhB domain-containing protein [Nocardiopsis tropica]
MSKLDREVAIIKAEEFLESESREWKYNDVKAMREKSFQHENDLIVPYNTISYLKTGKIEDGLVGNTPIRVNLETGACDFIDIIQVLDYRDMGYPV